MYNFRFFLIGLVLVGSTLAQGPLKGIVVADIDNSADACNDFFTYANGTWRKSNPIPASMPRWSRRWQAGEGAKDRLREILEDVSSKGPYKSGTVDQITSDFYIACKDEALADKNGIAPVKPMLAEIDKIKTRGDVQNEIAKLALVGI